MPSAMASTATLAPVLSVMAILRSIGASPEGLLAWSTQAIAKGCSCAVRQGADKWNSEPLHSVSVYVPVRRCRRSPIKLGDVHEVHQLTCGDSGCPRVERHRRIRTDAAEGAGFRGGAER